MDLHVHAGPDICPRSLSAFGLVQRAAQAGMADVVLKSHQVVTSSLAKLLQEDVTHELTVTGGVSLNRAVSGFNPEAVKASFVLGGRFVWFPAPDAANDRQAKGESGGLGSFLSGLFDEGFNLAELRTMSHTLPLELLQPKGHYV